jgi:hypothetical protein
LSSSFTFEAKQSGQEVEGWDKRGGIRKTLVNLKGTKTKIQVGSFVCLSSQIQSKVAAVSAYERVVAMMVVVR